MSEPWNLTEAQRRQFREAHAETKRAAMEIQRGADIMARLTAVLNGSGQFWVEASEIDGGTDVRLSVSDRLNDGPWITVIAETGERED